MWTIMMIAMMLPVASPLALRLARCCKSGGSAMFAPVSFLTGYFVIWVGFSILAAVGQTQLYAIAWLSAPMGRLDPLASSVLLVIAGAFQWSRSKEACLTQWRAAAGLPVSGASAGSRAMFVMGLRHGATCLICCWALMLLMFVGGVANVLWMATLTIYTLIERTAGRARTLSRAFGALLLAYGVALGAWSMSI
jgi:predicted metal-binding membrane protein